MRIQTDNEDRILAFARVGEINNGQPFSGLVPDNFEINFKPLMYIVQNGEIVLNPNYKESAKQVVSVTPTIDQQLIMAQAQQITTMQQMLMAQATDIAKLKQGVDQS